jgi:hypothetical protein
MSSNGPVIVLQQINKTQIKGSNRIFFFIIEMFVFLVRCANMAGNGLGIAEGGDF